jgi:hypothetical protein
LFVCLFVLVCLFVWFVRFHFVVLLCVCTHTTFNYYVSILSYRHSI